MIRTATVTWVKYHNYGTFLQAYALQRVLLELGVDNTILDDTNIGMRCFVDMKQQKSALRLSISKGWNLIRAKRRRLIEEYAALQAARDAEFLLFKEDFLRIRPIPSEEALCELNQEFDAFLCGSDQIWAPSDTAFSEYYYLRFADTGKLKIAYAPSLGMNEIPEGKKKLIKPLIDRLDCISVRETKGARLLAELTGREVSVVSDPTLLLDARAWENIASPPKIERPYILCYLLGNNKWYRSYVERLAALTGYEIATLPMRSKDLLFARSSPCACGPRGFVGLIGNASLVCTDSLHGTIFSILFNKPFVTFKRFRDDDPVSENSRLEHLLNLVSLNDRLIGEDNLDINLHQRPIDYRSVNDIVVKEREASIRYLASSLGLH